LRANGGGVLNEAVDVADLFLQEGEIVSQKGRSLKDDMHWSAKPGDEIYGAPLIVLVDAGTASASEVVSGALQDHHRALIMGQRTYGKGTVQTVMPLGEASDKREMTVTTSRYYTPSGRSIQELGIMPDVAVPQLSDPDVETQRKLAVREENMNRHLPNLSKVDDKTLETDAKPDPHFHLTATQLKARGISDYQLYYALETLKRVEHKLHNIGTKGAAHHQLQTRKH
jgi:carboxyl-terminal processing protease